MSDLFSPIELGPYVLPNRIVMAPMTRCRADADTVVNTITEKFRKNNTSTLLTIDHNGDGVLTLQESRFLPTISPWQI